MYMSPFSINMVAVPSTSCCLNDKMAKLDGKVSISFGWSRSISTNPALGIFVFEDPKTINGFGLATFGRPTKSLP